MRQEAPLHVNTALTRSYAAPLKRSCRQLFVVIGLDARGACTWNLVHRAGISRMKRSPREEVGVRCAIRTRAEHAQSRSMRPIGGDLTVRVTTRSEHARWRRAD